MRIICFSTQCNRNTNLNGDKFNYPLNYIGDFKIIKSLIVSYYLLRFLRKVNI